MSTVDVQIIRDLKKVPSHVIIQKGNRKLEALFDPQLGFKLKGRSAYLPSFSEILRMVYPVQTILSVRGMEWFDRNPESKADNYNAVIGPAGTAVRITYTCPADKVAMVELLQAECRRYTVATTPSDFYCGWYFTPVGGTETLILVARGHSNASKIGDGNSKAIGSTLMIEQDDRLRAATSDISTGGTVQYFMSYKITEFDA